MATIKFAEESPYKTRVDSCSETDFKYLEYLAVTSAQGTSKTLPPMGIAIFGLGRAGSIHLNNVISNRRMKLLYVVDSYQNRLDQIKKTFNLPDNAALHLDDSDKIFQDKEVEGVIIASPTATHEGLVIKSLNNGKGVLCEKPLSQDAKGISRCYNLAQKKKLPIFCAFNREFDPALRHLRNQVHQGKVGQVHMIKSVARDCPLPSIEFMKISGGLFHDCAVHDIDLQCWIMGEYPREVFAMVHSFIPEIARLGDFDTAMVTLKFPSGALGNIDMSRNAAYGYDQRVEVFGAKGMLTSSNQRPLEVQLSSKENKQDSPIYHSFPSRYHESYREELDHFYDLVKGNCSKTVTKEQILKINKIADCLEESVKTGRSIFVDYSEVEK